MRICMMVYEFPQSPHEPIVSGEIKNAYYLARTLHELGHEVTVVSVPVITKEQRGSAQEIEGIRVYNVMEGKFRGFVKYLVRALNVLRCITSIHEHNKFTIFHAHAPSLALGIVFGRLVRIAHINTPLIITAHGTYLPEIYGDLEKMTLSNVVKFGNAWLQFLVDQWVFQKAERVVAVSQYQVAEMVSLYKVPKNRLRVITNGVDLTRYRDLGVKPTRILKELGVERHKVILFVGRLARKKGLQYLIEAAPSIISNFPNVKFIIVGGIERFATFETELRNLIEKKGLIDRFIWLKAVPEEAMPNIYNAADICVVPSVNYESIPTVILEAMACGTPVVATEGWGIPEALGAGGVMVPEKDPITLAEQISKLLADEKFAQAVRSYQAERIKRFAWPEIARQYIALYNEVANEA